jgi:hypothetical protein
VVNDDENAPWNSPRIRLGSFCRVLWTVNIPEDPVVIELKDERCSKLIVEVANPKAAVELVRAGLPH